MRVCILFLATLCCSLRANHGANVFDPLGTYIPALSFTESAAQAIVGSGDNRETVDNYSGSFQILVESGDLATLTGASIVRIRIGTFLLDKTLADAPDYVLGGDHATFTILDGADPIGTVKAKWRGEKLTITGSLKSRIIPQAANSFHIPLLTEDDRYFISEASDVSLIFGDTSGSRKMEVAGKSTFKSVRIGTVDNPAYEDDLWAVSVVGALDFTPPKMKLLSPGAKTSAAPQRYSLSTSPDVEVVTVQLNGTPASDPLLGDIPDPLPAKPTARLWGGVLYLQNGSNAVRFTAIDRSGNSTSTTFNLEHDFRSGLYSGILDTGTSDMTRTLVIKVEPGGAFTGTLQLGLEKLRFSGTFNAQGDSAFTIPRKNGGVSLDCTFSLEQNEDDFVEEPDPKPTVLTATINDEFGSYTIDASRAVFDSENVQPQLISGYYTARIAPDPLLGGAGAPEGIGYITMKVGKLGTISALGKLADGTPFTTAGPLGGDGRFLVSAQLYRPADGLLQGFITFTAAEDFGSTCEGTLRWVQPLGATKASGLFPNGFNAECPVTGGIYRPGRRVVDLDTTEDFTSLGYTEAQVSLLLGEFGDTALVGSFDIDYRGNVRIVNPIPADRVKLTIKNKTGIFTGTAQGTGHTSPAKKIFGVIVGQEGRGEGTFTSKTDSGTATIEAR